MRPLMPGDGYMLANAINDTAPQLIEWMPWAPQDGVAKVEDCEETARRFYADFILRNAVHLIILHENNFVGMVGFGLIDWLIPSAEIGYWCRAGYQGKGIISEAANALTRYAFEVIKVRRLVITCDNENEKSFAVAERLKFNLALISPGVAKKPNCNQLRLGRMYVRFNTEDLPPLDVSW
jgi:RimJ/RimL family protein N-acetyltransferase